MISRRSLFSLIPAPFAAGLGLLTTSSEPTEAPESDPVAVPALAIASHLQTLKNYDAAYQQMLDDPDPRISLFGTFDEQRVKTVENGRRFRAFMSEKISRNETLLRERLTRSRGVSVVIDGRVYSAGRSRGNHLVEPVWVAMLTPSEGGGL